MNRVPIRAFLLVGACAVAPAARADIGVPMVAIFLPPMWLSLIPVILLESWILHRRLFVSHQSALLASTVGNVATTVVGIPLVWLVLAILEGSCCGTAHGLASFGDKIYAVTVQAPWLIPYEKDLGWMIPVALLVLFVPFFGITVAIEGYLSRRILPAVEPRRLWRATWLANGWSYLMLALLAWPALLLASHMQSFFLPILEWLVSVAFKVARVLAQAQ